MVGATTRVLRWIFYHRHERDLRLARARGQDDHAAAAVLLPSGDAFSLVRVWLRRGVQLQGQGYCSAGPYS